MSELETVQAAAAKLKADSTNPTLQDEAARALLAACATPGTLAAWHGPEKEQFYHSLLRQGYVLAHEAASNITSGNPEAVKALWAELGPIIATKLGSDPAKSPDDRGYILFALTTRGLAQGALDQAMMSRQHLAWFSQFDLAERALPYSVMFNPHVFGQNRDELLAHYWPSDAPSPGMLELPPSTVLMLHWLKGRAAFTNDKALEDYLSSHLPGPEAPAARSLLLHCWQGPTLPPLDRWNLEAQAEPLSHSMAHRRPAAPPDALRHLQSRPYQVLGLAKSALPAIFRFNRPPKVAVCVSGQLRGHDLVWPNWRQKLLRGVETHVFIQSWQKVGRSDAQPFRANLPFAGTDFPQAYRKLALARGIDAMRESYPTLFTELSQGATTTQEAVKRLYSSENVVLDDETQAPFKDYSNQQKMHAKIKAADDMAQAVGDFDLHLRIRPDLDVRLAAFDWHDIASLCRKMPVLFTEKPYGLHYGTLMIGDQFALGAPDTMAIYAGTWDAQPRLATQELMGMPDDYTGHVSLAMTSWLSALQIEKAPVKFGELCEARPMQSSEILAALEADPNPDQELLDAVRADLKG